MHNIELEKKLIKLGFKIKWLDDKSGYWLTKIIKDQPLKGLYLVHIVETDFKNWIISIEQRNTRPQYNDYMDVTQKYSEKNILNYYGRKK